jgi:hypothetical protein
MIIPYPEDFSRTNQNILSKKNSWNDILESFDDDSYLNTSVYYIKDDEFELDLSNIFLKYLKILLLFIR